MSRQSLEESLSAVMDGEADELELRRVLGSDDAALRARWARQQLVRDVMHGQTVQPHLDLGAGIWSVIEAEDSAVARPPVASNRWQRLGRYAVAASVTLAVLAGVRWYQGGEPAVSTLAQQAPTPVSAPASVVPPQAPAVLASYPATSEPVQESASVTDEAQILRALPADAADR
ncbi:RseA family anti-sigma factor [Pseudomonas sp. NW5]|uniref:sigma-E factor negative regulatory protein n=1 Tax=Pseudomonas sp. NW5 TaxID=2934934 RepID=UPI002020BD7A|nr:RseA family anti-sigma factor [Pseudomonas sp. NW5]MCL7461258.1 RseA family anti-sigma factor [Pseudomonas sp. NW5]